MGKLEALSEICMLLNTLLAPTDVIVNAHGIYQFVPAWNYTATVDELCSLDRFSAVAGEVAELETMADNPVIVGR